MKKITNLLLALSLTVCMLLALPIGAAAASTETKNGLEVTVITDKDEYTADEDIQVSVNIKNNNTYTVEDVSVEALLPEGLVLKSGSLSTADVDIEAGKTYLFSLVAQLSDELKKTTETEPENTTLPESSTESSDTTKNENTTEPNDTTVADDTTAEEIGEKSNIILWVVLGVVFVAAIVAAILLIFKFKHKTKVISLFLCIATVLAVLPISNLTVEADTSTVTVDKTINIDKRSYTINAKINTIINSGEIFYDIELNNFKASHFDIYIETTETVTFSVEAHSSTVLPKSISLCEGENVIAEMTDSGTNGDLVANDGIYTSQLTLSKPEIANISYHATCYGISSNNFEICYYRDLTQDEFVLYAQLLNTINQLSFEEAKSYVMSSNEISHYSIDENDQKITYKSIYGISGIWEQVDELIKGNGEFAIQSPIGVDYRTVYNDTIASIQNKTDLTLPAYPNANVYDQAYNTVSTISIEPDIANTDVVILRPFRTSQFTYDDFLNAGQIVSKGIGGSLTVIDDESVSLSVMKSLDQYGVVLIDSHGGISDIHKKTYVVTGETFDETRFLLDPIYYAIHIGYSADYLAGRIFGTCANRAGVSSKFFDKYYADNSLDESFWFLGCCYGFYNDTLADSLIGKGAEAVFGFTNVVSVWYCNNILFETVINSMVLSGNTLSEAVSNAEAVYGNQDPIVMAYNTLTTKIKYKGNSSFKLVNKIDVPKGTLSGKICKASDRITAIPNASIKVYKNGTLYTSSTSNSTGNYSISLPEGRYSVLITSNGYIDFKAYADVTVNENTYMETFLMIKGSTAQSGIASGKVINSLTGTGAPNVTLTIKKDWNNPDASSATVRTVVTDSDGYYSVSLPLGNYTVIATKEGYTSSAFNIIVQEGTTANQNGIITPLISGDNYLITLRWGENPRDLDSHVIGTLSNGNKFHVYYADKSQYDGDIEVCNLDYDDTTSYGPEHITLITTTDAPYYYYIHRYAGSGAIVTSEAQITVEQGNVLIAKFNVPTDLSTEDYWNVFAIKNGEIIVNNTITSSPNISYAE